MRFLARSFFSQSKVEGKAQSQQESAKPESFPLLSEDYVTSSRRVTWTRDDEDDDKEDDFEGSNGSDEMIRSLLVVDVVRMRGRECRDESEVDDSEGSRDDASSHHADSRIDSASPRLRRRYSRRSSASPSPSPSSPPPSPLLSVQQMHTIALVV
jgi:hypothetical protein